MELLLFDLVMGFALRLLFIATVKTLRFVAHHAWGLVIHHPFLVAIGVMMTRRAGWYDDWPTVLEWLPATIACLLLLATVRVLSHHPPKQIAETARHHAKQTQKWAGGVASARERRRDRKLAKLPPPPIAPPRPVWTDTTTDGFGDPLDDSGKRLYAYRQAGYGGWLDEDNHPVAEVAPGEFTRITAVDRNGERIIAEATS